MTSHQADIHKMVSLLLIHALVTNLFFLFVKPQVQEEKKISKIGKEYNYIKINQSFTFLFSQNINF